MRILIRGGRIVDPQSGHDAPGDVGVADGRIFSLGELGADFNADRTLDARGLVVTPGLVDLAARLREPGHEHEGMLESEMAAAIAGGVTSLVCLPDTDPVLDEPGLVEMLKMRAEKLHQSRVFPLGALTRGLAGEVLTEMAELTEAGCVGLSQADVSLSDTQVLQRALQYAATYGYTVWLRPLERYLGKGVAASGPLATRLGLSGVPVAAETIALHTIFELTKATRARVHLCRISSAAGIALVAQAKPEGLPVTCDVSINSLHLTDVDIGDFDSRMRLDPPLRQQRDRDAIRAALADGTVDALVSDHTPVDEDAKTLPFAEAEPGATGLELLLGLALKWGQEDGIGLPRALAVLTSRPASVLAASMGSTSSAPGGLREGAVADLCLFAPDESWTVDGTTLASRSHHTPFARHEMPGRVRCTVVAGRVAYDAAE